MEKKNRIVVIGGTACGPKSAARARRSDPHASITIIEQDNAVSVATCGLPYYVSGVITNEKSLIVRGPAHFKETLDIDVMLGTKAVGIDRAAHTVEVLNQKTGRRSTVPYDRLVLATGGSPVIPNLEGVRLQGVFPLTKISHANAVREWITANKVRRAVIVGAGLIGMEMAEALVARGLETSIVEALDSVLPAILDPEMAAYLRRHLEAKGVRLHLGQRLTGLDGDSQGRVTGVTTTSGKIEAGVAVIAIGTHPNTELARSAGLDIGSAGGIIVDEYMRTSDPDIYAGGDCVENVHRVTGRKMLAPLGSTANKHGRVIGTNVTGGSDTFPGIMGTAAVKVFNYNVGRTGLGETAARDAGFDPVIALVPGSEWATYYPESKEFLLKLVADRKTGRVLGGQAAGPGDVAKRIDVLVTAITLGATVDGLADLDLGYAPPYNSAIDPVHHAANVVRNKLSGMAAALTPEEVKRKIDAREDFILLDVRTPVENQNCRIAAPQVMLAPLGQLRAFLEKLPKDKEIVTICRASVRAYQAQRMLVGAGFKNAKYMDGSMVAWPYETEGDGPR